MKTNLLLGIILFLLPGTLSAQERGVTPTNHPTNQPASHQSTTYAVVVGISDYQDPGIPDLRFADRDAEAFANFLRSPAGGSLDGDHLKLLTNEQATGAQIFTALDWLIDVVQDGDRIIIYFSGHGDVESKRISQPGYLLGWDAPARVYAAGGTMNIRDFQDYISTLSVYNKGKVVVITDACRSGKLSGSDIDGTHLTSQNLARQFQNEIKILSCQPNEYSIEGEQWGGGRGAFSYHLIDGLYGMADGNGDLSVNLMEIGRYLQDKVTTEVAPQSQVPMTVGDFTEKLVGVNPDLLEQIKEGKKGQLQLFTPTESRGMEEDVLAAADSNIVEMYAAFQKAIAYKQFLEPANSCADFYYEILSREPQLEKLHSSMRRNYAAALQDDAQQAMNTMLKSGLTEMILKNVRVEDLYKNYPAYLERASELLGKDHYMYSILQARKYYFEGRIQKGGPQKRQLYREALKWQPDMPHAMVSLSYSFDTDQLDSVKLYFEMVKDLVPQWVEPYLSMKDYYLLKLKQLDKAEEMLNLAEQVDSTSILVKYEKARFYDDQMKYDLAEKWYTEAIKGISGDICFPCAHLQLGNVFEATKRYEEAEKQFKKAIQLAETDINFCSPCAYTLLADIYKYTGRNKEAEEHYKKAIQLDPSFAVVYNNLALLYVSTGRPKEAEEHYKKAIQLDSSLVRAYVNLGSLYSNTGLYKEAEEHFQKAIQLDSSFAYTYFEFGKYYLNTGRPKEAEENLNKAIQLDSTFSDAYNAVAIVYAGNQRYEEAEEYYKKAIQFSPSFFDAHNNLALVYLSTGRYAEAELQLKKIIQLDSTYSLSYYNLACLQSLQNQPDQAFEYLEQALKNGYDEYDWLQEDSDLAPLREQKIRWEALMKKYFPDKM